MKYLKLAHWLSLDVAIGAVAGYRFFSKMAGVDFDVYVAILLFCGVQCIYIFDRFFDLAQDPFLSSDRHRFHAQHKNALNIYLFFIGLVSVFLLFKLNTTVLRFGWMVCLIMVAYYFILRYLPKIAAYIKETMVAIVYSGTLAGLAYCFISPSWLEKLIIADYALVVFQSLMLYKIIEDFGPKFLAFFIIIIPFLLLCQIYFFESFYKPYLLTCIIMACLIAFIYVFRRFLPTETHRIPTELTFWLGLFC